MKTKKYQAETEEKVIEMAKEELGSEAIVLSIKKITPTGIFSVVKKPYIELVASYDETKVNVQDKKSVSTSKFILDEIKEKWFGNSNNSKDEFELKIQEKDKIIKELQKKLKETEEYLESAMKSLSKAGSSDTKVYENHLLQFIYDILIEQGVLPNICTEILDDISPNENDDIDFIVKIVYNKILNILNVSNMQNFDLDMPKTDKFAKNIVFLGTTGVGKTTTIAKLSSNLIMQNGLKVSFITADTYRIAAVEQLKIYGEILGTSVEVVYTPDEVSEKVDKLKILNDLIFFDTAGRSHKNKSNMKEIEELVKNIPNPDIYLVANSAMRFDDIMDIIKAYEKFVDFKLIFTKIDETSTLGSILNVSYLTKRKIAYITMGQNVPSDIERYSAEKIAKVLLGSMYK